MLIKYDKKPNLFRNWGSKTLHFLHGRLQPRFLRSTPSLAVNSPFECRLEICKEPTISFKYFLPPPNKQTNKGAGLYLLQGVKGESYKQEGRKINNDPGKGIMTAGAWSQCLVGRLPRGRWEGLRGSGLPGTQTSLTPNCSQQGPCQSSGLWPRWAYLPLNNRNKKTK